MAWSLPVVAAASAAPLVSASECTDIVDTPTPPGSIITSNNYNANYQKTQTTWTVPAGVVYINFDIAGGGGGVNQNDDPVTNRSGGHGHQIKGRITVTPGQIVTLIAGNGGIGLHAVAGLSTNSVIKGGEGYTNGGDIRVGGGAYRYAAGTGGGSSAILIDNVPIVVAGGGGGGGGGTVDDNAGYRLEADSRGGDGGFTAGHATPADSSWRPGQTRVYFSVTGGRGATGTTPGAGGTGSTVTTGGTLNPHVYGATGSTAGRGADGVGSGTRDDVSYTSGGGGGGWRGGGSGSAIVANVGNVVYGALGGGGGGGSSYRANSATNPILQLSEASARNGSGGSRIRRSGWAQISTGTC